MATYNFDKIINRKGTNCLKYDYAVERGKPADVLPLWVADMDFTVSEEITKSLHAAVDHGIYGYTQPKDAYYNAITNWMEKNHNWKTKRGKSFHKAGRFGLDTKCGVLSLYQYH